VLNENLFAKSVLLLSCT